MNEFEAIAAIAIRPPELGVESRIGGSNPLRYAAGLALKQIAFSVRFTTKADCMGMGVSIYRTLENRGGRLSASPNCQRRTVFWFALQTSPESPS